MLYLLERKKDVTKEILMVVPIGYVVYALPDSSVSYMLCVFSSLIVYRSTGRLQK